MVSNSSLVVVNVTQSCPTLCKPMDYSLPGSSVHGIFQARILEWIATYYSRRPAQPREQTHVSCIGRQILQHWATWEALYVQERVVKYQKEMNKQWPMEHWGLNLWREYPGKTLTIKERWRWSVPSSFDENRQMQGSSGSRNRLEEEGLWEKEI